MYRASTGYQKHSAGHTGDSLEVAEVPMGLWSEMCGCDDRGRWRGSQGATEFMRHGANF